MLTPDEQTRASCAQSEREELIDALEMALPPHLLDLSGLTQTADALIAAGYHNGPRIPDPRTDA